MPKAPIIGIACPACAGEVGYNGRCTQCGAQAFEPPPRWERVLMAVAVAVVIAAQCAAAPFYLIFALGVGVYLLWLSWQGRPPFERRDPSLIPARMAPTGPPSCGTGPAPPPRP